MQQQVQQHIRNRTLKMNVENKECFLRNWLSTISNPTSNVLQVLQDKFQSKFDEYFSDIENKDCQLYPLNHYKEIYNTDDKIINKDNFNSNFEKGKKKYQDKNGKVFSGTLINGERSGRGILSWKEKDANIEVQVEGFYHKNLLVGNVARITKGKFSYHK